MNKRAGSYLIRREMGKEPLWRGRGPELVRLDIELTERCNNNCIHCYINQPANHVESRRREMGTRQVQDILGEAATMGCLSVRFTGGEPLLRPDFEDIYLHARRLGIKVSLYTNGTLVTPELAALFAKYPPGEPVEITLYGMTPSAYEAVSRVRGSFAAAMAGIELLTEKAIPVTLKSIRRPGCEQDLAEFRMFAEKYSVRGKAGGISMDFNLRARRDDPEKNEAIKRLRATPEETLAYLSRDRAAFVAGKKQFAARFMRPGGERLFTCGCGKGGSVDAYGFLQPCLLLRHPDLVYDLAAGSISDALNRFFPAVLERRAENPCYRQRCARCFLKGLCEQCPAWSWMEHGTLDTPVDYLCGVAHAQARSLGLLGADESAWQVEDWQKRIDAFVEAEGAPAGPPRPFHPGQKERRAPEKEDAP